MMILGIAIIAIIVIVYIHATRKDKLETVIDIFDTSDDITFISSKLNDYIKSNCYAKGKHFLMFYIIRSLINKKRIAQMRAMRRNFINNDIILTMDIIADEVANIEDNIITYRSDLNSKLFKIMQLDNSIENIV
jgi:hypothetical protein